MKTRNKINQEKEFLGEGLKALTGFHPLSSSTNYLLVDISGFKKTSDELYQLLAASGILIRNCSSFRGLQKDYIRIAVKSRSQNKLLLKELKKL